MNQAELYLSPDEIHNDILLSKLDEQTKRALRDLPQTDLIMCHHTFGRWIRNFYRLWEQDNPYTMLHHQPDLQNGVDHSVTHPDYVSQKIIERLWRTLNGK